MFNHPRSMLLVLSGLLLTTWMTTGRTQGGTGTPFGGTRPSLPGTVQAENFNEGGEGVAYHDNSPANEGGQYRATGVDIASAADVGGGFTLGWVGTGEWLNYDVNVTAAGLYDIAVRVASAGVGGRFHIEVNGVDKTGPMLVPNTGGWQTWSTVTKSGVSLSAGPQVWRIDMDERGPSGAVGNFNHLRVVAAPSGLAPYGGTPPTLPGTIEVERFDEGGAGVAYNDTTSGNSGGKFRTTDVDIDAASDAGGGYLVGWMKPGEWLKYSVNVAAAGTYTLQFRVAASTAGARFHVEVNGTDKTGPIVMPATGGPQAWSTVTVGGVTLAAGSQVWTLVVDSANAIGGVGNINFIRVASSSAAPASTPFGGTRVVLPNTIQVENFDDGGRGVAYVDTTAGNAGGQYRATDVDIDRAIDVGAGYLVGWLTPGEWLNYSVSVPASGTYTLEARVAASTAGARFHIEADGVDKTGPLTFPATAGPQAWTTIWRSGISLPAGQQILTLVIDSANPSGGVGNINWIRIVPAGAAARGPYLQQMADTSVVVVWTTREPGPAAVRFTASGQGVRTASAVTRFFPATDTGLGYDAYQHEARLTGLTAATRYSYDLLRAGVDTTPGQESFTSAPGSAATSIRFVAFGDSGVGSAAQYQLADRIAADTFDLALHGGDVVYGSSSGVGSAGYRQYENWFFSVYGTWLRSRPMFPAIGNHDDEVGAARAYRDVFVLPENGASPMFPDNAERFYSFDYGPVHFVALDTELAFQNLQRRAAQLAWLDADLAATDRPWKIVYFHRPPYNAGTRHGSDLAVRQAFAPLFERHGVQLAIAAHEHDYERSVPWREFEPLGGRVVYVVSGGGGAPLYPAGRGAWTATSVSAHHYLRVTISGCTLTGQAVGTTGGVFDTFSIDRCAAAAAAPPALEQVREGRR